MTPWTDDEGLMEELARATREEREVPDRRRRAAYAAFAWRTIDEDLMSLTHDSLLSATAAVRGPEDARTLAFQRRRLIPSSSRWTDPSSRDSCSWPGAWRR